MRTLCKYVFLVVYTILLLGLLSYHVDSQIVAQNIANPNIQQQLQKRIQEFMEKSIKEIKAQPKPIPTPTQPKPVKKKDVVSSLYRDPMAIAWYMLQHHSDAKKVKITLDFTGYKDNTSPNHPISFLNPNQNSQWKDNAKLSQEYSTQEELENEEQIETDEMEIVVDAKEMKKPESLQKKLSLALEKALQKDSKYMQYEADFSKAMALLKQFEEESFDLSTNDGEMNYVEQAIALFEKYPEDPYMNYHHGNIFKTNKFGRFDLNKALTLFEKANSLGDINSKFELSLFYRLLEKQGTFVNSTTPYSNTAFSLLELFFAAMAGSQRSQMALAYRHLYGIDGAPKDCMASARYYKLAAAQTVKKLDQENIVSVAFKSSGDHLRLSDDTALQSKQLQNDVMNYYKFTAEKGAPTSQLLVGYAHMFGLRGMERDGRLAREYFERLVEMEVPEAYGPLGQLYLRGAPGIEINNTTAFHYFEQGAELGDSNSRNGLGYMYLHGIAPAKLSYEKAFFYFNASATQGNAEAQYNLAMLYLNGPDSVEQNLQKAVIYFSMAATQGQLLANFQLGLLYLGEEGVSQNCELAVKHLRLVAEKSPYVSELLEEAFESYIKQDYITSLIYFLTLSDMGIEIAQSNAGYLYDHGLGTEWLHPNATSDAIFKRAMLLYKQASLQGSMEAHIKVGDYYYYGVGCPIDYKQAVEFYKKASTSAQALFNLGYMHQHGIGLEKDFFLAKRFYDSAMSADEEFAYIPVLFAFIALLFQWGISLLKNGGDDWLYALGDDGPQKFGWISQYFYSFDIRDVFLIFLFVILLGLLFVRYLIFVGQQRFVLRQQQQQQQEHAHQD